MSEDPAISAERSYLKSRGWIQVHVPNPRGGMIERWFDPEHVGHASKDSPGASRQTALTVQRARDAKSERDVWREAAAAAVAHGHGSRNESGECCYSTAQVGQIADAVLAAYRSRWNTGPGE